MQRHEAAHDREAQAQSTAGAVERLTLLGKQVEYARQHVGLDADTGVADADGDPRALALGRHRHVPPWVGVLARVREEVGEHLREPPGIHADRVPAARHGHGQVMAALLEQRARHLDGARDDVGDLDARGRELDFAAGDARHVEQVVDETRQVLHLPRDDRALLLAAHDAPQLHHAERRHDGRERVAQFVPEHRHELVLRAADAVELRGQVLGLLARDHLFGDVDGEDQDAVDVALRVAHRLPDPVEEPLVEAVVAAPIQHHRRRRGFVTLAGRADAVEELPHPLFGELRQRLAARAAEQLRGRTSDQSAIGRVRQLVHVTRTAQDGDRGGGFHEELVQLRALAQSDASDAREVDLRADARHELAGRRTA